MNSYAIIKDLDLLIRYRSLRAKYIGSSHIGKKVLKYSWICLVKVSANW